MTIRSKRGNGDVGEISAMEAISELSSKLLLIVSSIDSKNEELMYTIRRENQMTHEVMQTLIEETKRATNVTEALLEKNITVLNTTVQQCTNKLKTEFREAIAANLKIQNKDEIENAKKNIEETWNDKVKKQNDIFLRYYRNKRINELFQEELEKENPILPRRFQIRQRDHEADEEYEIRKEFGKESIKTELNILQVRFIRQQKLIMDIDIIMTNWIRNQYTEDIAVNLIQKWKKEFQAAEERTKVNLIIQKEKWFKENWNFEYKPRIDEENKTNLQQHKDLESGLRKPNKIPRNCFKFRKRKSEEETIETSDFCQKDSI